MDEDGAAIEDEDQQAPGPHKQHISQRRNDRVLPQTRGICASVQARRNYGNFWFWRYGAESRPACTRMVAVVYGSEGGELGFPSVAQ